jgi:triacylglycerol lipase
MKIAAHKVGLAVLLAAVLALPSPVAGAQDVFSPTDPDVTPVLLVPGWGDQAADIEPLRQRFLDGGWSESRVRAVDFEDPVGSNRTNALEIARAVETLKGLTGVERVDLVAHSMGGLALRYYLQFEGGAEHVRRAVFLGTPHRGTVAAMLAWGEGGREMVPGSTFLADLNEGLDGVDGVELLAIRTPVDLRVIPGSSATLPDALNLEVCCPTHNQLVENEEVFERTRAFLLEGPSGVPDAERSKEQLEWSGVTFRSWNPWDELWAESLMRRWLLPSGRREEGAPNRE